MSSAEDCTQSAKCIVKYMFLLSHRPYACIVLIFRNVLKGTLIILYLVYEFSCYEFWFTEVLLMQIMYARVKICKTLLLHKKQCRTLLTAVH